MFSVVRSAEGRYSNHEKKFWNFFIEEVVLKIAFVQHDDVICKDFFQDNSVISQESNQLKERRIMIGFVFLRSKRS